MLLRRRLREPVTTLRRRNLRLNRRIGRGRRRLRGPLRCGLGRAGLRRGRLRRGRLEGRRQRRNGTRRGRRGGPRRRYVRPRGVLGASAGDAPWGAASVVGPVRSAGASAFEASVAGSSSAARTESAAVFVSACVPVPVLVPGSGAEASVIFSDSPDLSFTGTDGSASMSPASVVEPAVASCAVPAEGASGTEADDTAASASAAASRSAISCFSAAGENRIVAPLSRSPPPNGSAAPLPAPVPSEPAEAEAGPAAPVSEDGTDGADGADGAAGTAGAGGAGDQFCSNPPPAGSPGTGAPCGGGGGARCDPAPPDESPDALCVYQAGGV